MNNNTKSRYHKTNRKIRSRAVKNSLPRNKWNTHGKVAASGLKG